MKYEVIFFDVDDTLIDFGISEKNAMDKAFHRFGMPEGWLAYQATYSEINKRLWLELEQGIVSLDELGVERFSRLFSAHELSYDAVAFNEEFLANLAQETPLIQGAQEVCSSLARCRLAIISNGFAEVQKARIAASPLRHAFEHLIISQEAGFQKPDARIFDYAFSKLQVTDKSKALIVGDSLTSDIRGGHNYGIDTCWFNPQGKENRLDIEPTYEIRDLTHLLELVRLTADERLPI
ncbi:MULTISPECIES: YjjG family noncanonical pyrimidine nucleotidase [Brevibacillus]|uniref:Noncanonical pyrimidine nucleotidase, YjjG family protein n=1 Tax=Brevibacillus parabrevis TaxID=54914 RepID=A0A4Y3PAA9_BREPA|nr:MULTISPECIES: YjjG family noncanonical pyrimidine nucleotidase [Brevibacillus]RNB97325.1 noncanonical pyrimidine nucleotidase, YjjG family [Brevibacillus parabrevis]UED68700.1 YjjG family noncanonical pyrimidine nucleotidase [Brevibacillus sp. HD3.3A]GEB31362.1 noncanonical pyrimidine nucleotidase, YjjG family protein [Brevibacillus parabrevis]